MLAQQTRPEPPAPDRSVRSAALWATAVAVPVAVLAAVLLLSQLDVLTGATAPGPSPTTPAVASTAPVSTGPVPMAAPKLSARAATLCRALTAQLPAAVRNMLARPVTAGPRQNAAYGDPAVTVSCGVPQPEVADESLLMNMKSAVGIQGYVCWYTRQGPGTTLLTTVNREVPVQVAVPVTYDAAAQWANEFSDTIIATVPPIEDVPAGCA
jgi:hypothetical protein